MSVCVCVCVKRLSRFMHNRLWCVCACLWKRCNFTAIRYFFCFVFVCFISNDALFALIALIRPIVAYALWSNAKKYKSRNIDTYHKWNNSLFSDCHRLRRRRRRCRCRCSTLIKLLCRYHTFVAHDDSHFQLISLLFWVAFYAFALQRVLNMKLLIERKNWKHKKQIRQVKSHLWMRSSANGCATVTSICSSIDSQSANVQLVSVIFAESDDNESISNVAHPMNCNLISVDRCTVIVVFIFIFQSVDVSNADSHHTHITHQMPIIICLYR